MQAIQPTKPQLMKQDRGDNITLNMAQLRYDLGITIVEEQKRTLQAFQNGTDQGIEAAMQTADEIIDKIEARYVLVDRL